MSTLRLPAVARLAGPLLVALIALTVAAVVLAVAGFSPAQALAALVSGAFGDSRRVALTLQRATPLLFTGLGVALAFRAGLWNIGAEGQLIAGALTAVWLGTSSRIAGLPGAALLVLAAGTLAGALFGAIPGALRALRAVPEVIVTILLNFVALEALSWLVQGRLREAGGAYPQTDRVAESLWLRPLGGIPPALIVAVAAAAIAHLALAHLRSGFALRLHGANPEAARAAGIRVGGLTVAVLALSGALAGMAGAAEMLGSVHRLYEGYAPGYGFTAIAVALIARLTPLGVVPAALFFGALSAGSDRMEARALVPAAVAAVIQAVVVLGSVWIGRRARDGR